MITTYNDILDKNLIKNIFDYLKSILGKNVWSSSNGWDQDLVLNSSNSSNSLTHTINDKHLYTNIKNSKE
jgi:hypothetical protein